MGRLFWRIVIGFWLTLAVISYGVSVSMQTVKESPKNVHIVKNEAGPKWPVIRLEINPEFAIGLLASLLFSAALARNLTKPIQQLRASFDDLSRGKLGTRAPGFVVKRRDELGGLARDFNTMAQKLEQLIISRQRLLHDLSHELRSPLARLHVAIGLAQQQPESTKDALDRIEAEANKLDELVGEVLSLARLDSSVSMPLNDYIDVVEMVKAVVEDAQFESSANVKNISLKIEHVREWVIRGNVAWLHRAIDNVMRNALKHAKKQVTVEVSVVDISQQLRICVADDGVGVDQMEIEAIFEPFYRADGSGSGYGLGLNITRKAISAHGGTVRAFNQPESGLKVEILLPKT
ncbi:MAG TPA: ATP-binding protein [Pseudomonadales bacterium]|nr:ATP-binding protein [Pseudomonadales bacterium]